MSINCIYQVNYGSDLRGYLCPALKEGDNPISTLLSSAQDLRTKVFLENLNKKIKDSHIFLFFADKLSSSHAPVPQEIRKIFNFIPGSEQLFNFSSGSVKAIDESSFDGMRVLCAQLGRWKTFTDEVFKKRFSTPANSQLPCGNWNFSPVLRKDVPSKGVELSVENKKPYEEQVVRIFQKQGEIPIEKLNSTAVFKLMEESYQAHQLPHSDEKNYKKKMAYLSLALPLDTWKKIATLLQRELFFKNLQEETSDLLEVLKACIKISNGQKETSTLLTDLLLIIEAFFASNIYVYTKDLPPL